MTPLSHDSIVQLIKAFIISQNGGVPMTPSDLALLQDWKAASPENLAFFEEATQPGRLEDAMSKWTYFGGQVDAAIERFRKRTQPSKRSRPIRLAPWLAAASVLGIATILTLLHPYKQKPPASARVVVPQDVDPGIPKATLTLADGSLIQLDQVQKDNLAWQGGAQVKQLKGGRLAYMAKGAAVPSTNTIATPRGGTYQVILSDGSKVWLNAGSSMSFPAVFQGPSRSIAITGEAYFEIAKDPGRPFLVRAGADTIRVLGTRFNLSYYGDEKDHKTTLLDGAVKVSSGSQSFRLMPGQALVSSDNGRLTTVTNVDTETVVAWKNGNFNFDHLGLFTVMKQISRWYNVDIEYDGAVDDKALLGYIPRATKLSTVLDLLRSVGVKCALVEGKVKISP